MSEAPPERDASGRLKGGGPSLNRSGRPRKEAKSHRNRLEFSLMVLNIAERTSVGMSKDVLAGLSLLERSTLRLAVEGANGNTQSGKAFIEQCFQAATFLEHGQMAKLQAKLAETERKLERAESNANIGYQKLQQVHATVASKLAQAEKELGKTKAELAAMEDDLRSAQEQIATLKADRALT